MKKHAYTNSLSILLIAFLMAACAETKEKKAGSKKKKKEAKTCMTVTATAYNPFEYQTKKGNIGLTAWGDTLEPGDYAIAVSRDLINMGLDHNTKVEIEGLDHTYIVKDKMNKRWKKRIDIYMGLDRKAARKWGKKKVEIRFVKKEGPKE